MSKLRVELTVDEALEAIRARIDGEWDNPALKKFGELSSVATEDIREIIAGAQLAEARSLIRGRAAHLEDLAARCRERAEEADYGGAQEYARQAQKSAALLDAAIDKERKLFRWEAK
jgi:hypothetical protein